MDSAGRFNDDAGQIQSYSILQIPIAKCNDKNCENDSHFHNSIPPIFDDKGNSPKRGTTWHVGILLHKWSVKGKRELQGWKDGWQLDWVQCKREYQ